jgi:hypothetical protein
MDWIRTNDDYSTDLQSAALTTQPPPFSYGCFKELNFKGTGNEPVLRPLKQHNIFTGL